MGPARRALPLLLLGAAAGCAEEPTVGVIDVEQAFQRSPLAMVSAIQLKQEFAPVQRDLKKRGRELAELRRQLEHGGLDPSADQRARIEGQIADESARLAELQRRYRADLAAAQARQGEEMIARVEEVAHEVAREKGLTLLLQKGGILYAAEEVDVERLDITEPVIRALLDKINPTEIPDAEP